MSENKDDDIIIGLMVKNETLDAIGKRYGITRERVRQIFKNRMGISHVKASELLAEHVREYRCVICGGEMKYGELKKGAHFCSDACRKITRNYNWQITQTCENCGCKYHPIRISKYVKSDHHFCSAKCHFQYEKAHGSKIKGPTALNI